MVELPTTLTNKPSTHVKECYLFMSIKLFRSAEWWTFISQWLKFHFPIFLVRAQNPKCLFILFQYTDVYLCAKFGELMPTINEMQRPQIWICFWARCKNKIPHGNCDFLLTKYFINIYLSSCPADCAAET